MPSGTTGLGRLRLQVFYGLGGLQDSLTCHNCLQRQKFLGNKGIIWLIKYYLTQHHQSVILIRRRFIFIWVYLSNYHTTRVVTESGFWACIYIFYSNRSSMVINLRGLDKYESNHTGDGQTDGKTRTEVCTGKIYEFVRLNVTTTGVTDCWTLMTRVSWNVVY